MASALQFDPLKAHTKGEIKRLRLTGYIPVSVQHKGMATRHFQQATRPLREYLEQHGEGTLLDALITADNQAQRLMVHQVQRDGVTHALLQVTFQQMRLEDRLKTHVPLHFRNEPKNADAMMQHRLDSLEIECSQGDLPESILVDLGGMQRGDVLRVSDLPANPHYTILAPPDTALASLVSNRTGVGDAPAEPAAPAA